MKNLTLFIAIILFGTSAFSQEYVMKFSTENFNSSQIRDISKTKHGTALISVNNGWELGVIEIGEAGNIIRTDSLGDTRNYMNKFVGMPDGKMLQYGWVGYTNRGAFAIRDSNRTILKDTFIRESSWSGALTYIHTAIVDNSGNIYFGGHIYDIFSGGVSFYSWNIPVIGKFNKDLELQWTKTISTHNSNSNNRRSGRPTSMAFDADSNIIIIGAHSHRYVTTGKDFIVKVNPIGQTLWSKEKLSGAGSGVSSPSNVVTDVDGNSYILKRLPYQQTSGFINGFTVEKFSTNGGRVWGKKVIHPSTPIYTTDMDITGDNKLIIVGQVDYTLDDGLYIQMDSSGTVDFSTTTDLSNNYSTYFNNVEVLDDDFALVGGHVHIDDYIVRVAPNGIPVCSTDTFALTADTFTNNWSNGVNLGGKGILYYPVTLASPTSGNTTTDTNCFIAPSCDVVASFTISDTTCNNESATFQSTSVGTGISAKWYIDGSLAGTGYNYDTVLASGTYEISQITKGAYCTDTADTQTLVVLDTYQDTAVVHRCVGDSFMIGGQYYFTDTARFDTLIAMNGCDSFVYFDLAFFEFFTEIEDTICSNETFVFGGQNLTSSGIYYDTVPGYIGCDSVIELTFTVLNSPTTALYDTICDGSFLSFYSQSLQSAGTYTHSLTAANGCDSVLSMNLHVLPNSHTYLSDSICAGDTLMFNGQSLHASGNYTYTTGSANGCDSTAHIALTVLPNSFTILTDSICDGDTLIFNGQELTTTGTYTHVETSANGCDSTVTMALTVLLQSYTSLTDTICDGDTFLFNGQQLTISGAYMHVEPAINGCDSNVSIDLTVLPNSDSTLFEAICDGETLDFNGQLVNAAGTYTHVEPSANGCDSTVTLHLTILEHSDTNLFYDLCAKDTYDFHGQMITDSGSYSHVAVKSNGCDSIIFLEVSLLKNSKGSSSVHICQGETVELGTQVISEEGEFQETFVSANGCDSVHTLTVTVADIEAKVGVFGDTLKSIFPAEVYEWIRCPSNAITGVYTKYFVPGDYQFYALVAYDSNFCTDTSWCFKTSPPKDTSTTGLGSLSSNAIRVFPNPTNQDVFLEGIQATSQVRWFDASGRLVMVTRVDVDGFVKAPKSSGVYLLQLEGEDVFERHRVIVTR